MSMRSVLKAGFGTMLTIFLWIIVSIVWEPIFAALFPLLDPTWTGEFGSTTVTTATYLAMGVHWLPYLSVAFAVIFMFIVLFREEDDTYVMRY